MFARKYALILVILALTFSSLACGLNFNFGTVRGSGNTVDEQRSLTGFDRVVVTAGMHLFVEQSEEFSVTLTAEDNIMPYILTEVSGDTLTFFFDNSERRSFRTTRPIDIRINMPEVEALNGSGGSRIETGPLQGTSLSLEVSGGGQANLESVTYQILNCDLSGGSRAELTGEVERQTVQVSGGGQYNAGDLRSSEAQINMSGGGQGTVWVTGSLNADLSGGAQLGYYGNPQVSQNTSGGSTVNFRGDK
jgi:hypothetical protein